MGQSSRPGLQQAFLELEALDKKNSPQKEDCISKYGQILVTYLHGFFQQEAMQYVLSWPGFQDIEPFDYQRCHEAQAVIPINAQASMVIFVPHYG